MTKNDDFCFVDELFKVMGYDRCCGCNCEEEYYQNEDIYWTSTDKSEVLEIYMPGFNKEEVFVNVKRGEIKIVWEKREYRW